MLAQMVIHSDNRLTKIFKWVWYGTVEFNVSLNTVGHFGDGSPEQWCAPLI